MPTAYNAGTHPEIIPLNAPFHTAGDWSVAYAEEPKSFKQGARIRYRNRFTREGPADERTVTFLVPALDVTRVILFPLIQAPFGPAPPAHG